MKNYLIAFLVGVGLVLIMLVFFWIGKEMGYAKGYDDALNLPHKSDTVEVIKTVEIEKPVEVVKWKDREKLVYVPVDSLIYVHDTTLVAMEREYKQYKDETYEAQVSGVDPSLDWIRINQKTEYITNTVVKKQKWGFGVTVGPGVVWDGKVHGGVGIVAGLSYNF